MPSHIYLDEETKIILKKIKERDANFNFSGFVKECLRSFFGENEEYLDKTIILAKLNSLDNQKETIDKELEHWKRLQLRAEARSIEEEKKKKQKREEAEEQKQERIDAIMSNIKTFYNFEDLNTIQQIALEYYEKHFLKKTEPNFFKFVEKHPLFKTLKGGKKE